MNNGSIFTPEQYDIITNEEITRLKELVVNNVIDVNAISFNRSGDSLIHYCIYRPTKLKFLLENKANPNVQTFTGNTPLHLATIDGLSYAITMLLEYGAKLDIEDCNGLTPLLMGVKFNRKDVVELLLNHGARICPQTEWPWLEEIRLYQISTVQNCIFTFILCCKNTRALHKDIIQVIAKQVWEMRWDPSWRKQNHKKQKTK